MVVALVLAGLSVWQAASNPAAGAGASSVAWPEGEGPPADGPVVRHGLRPEVEPISLEEVRRAGLSEREAMYYEKLPENEVQCKLCANLCILRDGERGQCRVRANFGGTLRTLVYGRPLSARPDPIEKKPLFHFLPGTQVFSIATAGCCLRCRFCQNWEISQEFPERARHIEGSPEDVIRATLATRCVSVAFTYTEPTVFYEYMLDTAKLAKEHGIRTVWVTCGYLNEEPLVELCKYLDGANVDLKGFTEEYYKEYCEGKLQPVLDTLKVLKREEVFFEVTNLIVPGGNDDPKMIEEMCVWIRDELGAETPLHFSRYHPAYKMQRPGPTPKSTLVTARDIALKVGLKHVYIGNVRGGGGETTSCPKCGEELIVRWGYLLRKNVVKDGRCPKCGEELPGVWK